MATGKDKYSDPKLRDRIKEKIKKSSKGGAAGQWSARKAQLMAQEYKKAGGGYRQGPDASQKSLKKWTKEEWTTADGEKAQRKGGTARYLPKKAWSKLTDSEKKATNTKKQAGARAGKQFVGNTPQAEKAGSKVRHSSSAKKAGKKKKTAKTSKKTTKKKVSRATKTKSKKSSSRGGKKKSSGKKIASRRSSASRSKRSSKKG